MTKDIVDIYRCKTVDELEKIGQRLLEKHYNKKVFAFFGEMGVGKTSFIKILCRLLGAEESITSPTFSIVNEYKTRNNNSLYHFDMYRINADELFDIGYEEYFFSGNYCFIEWADKIKHLLPEETVVVEMKEVDGERVVLF